MGETTYTVKMEETLYNCWIYDSEGRLVGHTLKENILRYIKGPQYYDDPDPTDGLPEDDPREDR